MNYCTSTAAQFIVQHDSEVTVGKQEDWSLPRVPEVYQSGARKSFTFSSDRSHCLFMNETPPTDCSMSIWPPVCGDCPEFKMFIYNLIL